MQGATFLQIFCVNNGPHIYTQMLLLDIYDVPPIGRYRCKGGGVWLASLSSANSQPIAYIA